MTSREYVRLYREARAQTAEEVVAVMREMRRTYIEAAREAARSMRAAQMSGLSDITVDSWARIERTLLEGAEEISKKLGVRVPTGVRNVSETVTLIDETYLIDMVKKVGAEISTMAIKNLFVSIDDKVMQSLITRSMMPGYTFSDKIWRASASYQDVMKRVIQNGLSLGRDAIDVAADLNSYVKSGRRGLMKRWGELKRGEARFVARIRKDVDYNAMRLVRSELYASLQEASMLSGEVNPACTGMYEWVRYNTTDYGCECQELADGGPYATENLPTYPHPNCLCQVRPVLMDGGEFLEDLKRWQAGGQVDYLDDWNRNVMMNVA